MLKFQDMLKKSCMFLQPLVSDIYNKIKILGRGGQAVVNLYRKKGTNSSESDE